MLPGSKAELFQPIGRREITSPQSCKRVQHQEAWAGQQSRDCESREESQAWKKTQTIKRISFSYIQNITQHNKQGKQACVSFPFSQQYLAETPRAASGLRELVYRSSFFCSTLSRMFLRRTRARLSSPLHTSVNTRSMSCFKMSSVSSTRLEDSGGQVGIIWFVVWLV